MRQNEKMKKWDADFNEILESGDENVDQKILDFCIDTWFIPVAKEILKNENFQSVCVALSSHYSDQADDEIHEVFLPCSTIFGGWNDLLDVDKNKAIENDDDYKEYGYWNTYDLTHTAYSVVFEDRFGPYVGNDEKFISIMTKFCNEGSEGDPMKELYSPFIVVEKDGDNFNIRKVFEIVRVWK